MAKDRDYVDPAALKARAAKSGGLKVKPSRPRVHRVTDSGVRIVGTRTMMKNVRASVRACERAIDASKSRLNIS